MKTVPRPTTMPEVVDRLTAALTRAEVLLAPLDRAGLERRAGDGGWTVAQIIEHLCVTADGYIARIRPAMDRLREKDPVPEDRRFRSALLGRLLIAGVDPGNARRIKSPGAFKPSAKPRDDVRDHLLRLFLELLGLARAATGRPLDRTAFGTPVSPLVRVNVWDGFVVNTLHLERHLDQVARILEQE